MLCMCDIAIVQEMLLQIQGALERITRRFSSIEAPEDFLNSEKGEVLLDSIAMLLIAIGENVKRIDQRTSGELLSCYPEIDWKGGKGIRDVISHQYFSLNEEQIFSVCKDNIPGLTSTIKKMIADCK